MVDKLMDSATRTVHLVPRRGISVLAYTSDDPTLWPCTLFVRHCDTPRTTLSLKFSIRGFDKEEFLLIYHACNLVPGKAKLDSTIIPLPQDLRERISRPDNGNPQLQTLSLTLKETCPVYGLPSSGGIAPQSDLDPSLHQLVQFAGALQIHILFDYHHVHHDQLARFKCLTDDKTVWKGSPVEPTGAKRYQLNRSSLILVEDAVSGAPPPYPHVPNKKRLRRFAPSTSPERPSSRRRDIDAPSPTEKGTPPLSPPAYARSSSPCITPTEKGTPPLSPPPYAPPSDKAIRDALATILPLLHTILPKIIRTLVDAEVAARINAQQSEIDDGMLEHAAQIHNELDETLGDYRHNMNEAKEEGMEEMNTALNAVIDEGLQDFEVSTQEIVQGLDEHVKDVFTKTCEGLDDLVGEKLASLQREMKKLEQKQQQHLEQKNRTGQSKRATSLPL